MPTDAGNNPPSGGSTMAGGNATPASVTTEGSVAGTVVSGLTGARGTQFWGSDQRSFNRGNRHNNRNRGNKSNRSSAPSRPHHSSTAFKGRQEGLEAFVYDLLSPTAAASSYAVTTERIAEFVGTEWTGAGLIRDEIMTMEVQEHPEPPEPDSSWTAWKKKLAETEGNEWVKDIKDPNP